jgi:hypothetical protein
MICNHETCDESICLQPGYRIVENGECGAQLEIKDCELRASMARNIAHALERERLQTFKEAARHIETGFMHREGGQWANGRPCTCESCRTLRLVVAAFRVRAGKGSEK